MFDLKLSAAQIKTFKEDGFVNGGQLLTAQEVETLKNELDRVIAQQDDKSIPQPVNIHNMARNTDMAVWQIVNIWMASKPFASLLENTALGKAAASLIDAKEIRLWHDQIQYKPKMHGGVNMWHQDWPYWPTLSEPHQVTAWLALDEADESNGCMSMAKGSHKWGDNIADLHLIKKFEDLPKEYRGQKMEPTLCPVKSGHVHFHHGLTWHGSNKNTSQRPRRALALHFMGERTKLLRDKQHICKVLAPDTVKHGDMLEGKFFPLVYAEHVLV